MNFVELGPYITNQSYPQQLNRENRISTPPPSSVAGMYTDEASRGDIPAVQETTEQGRSGGTVQDGRTARDSRTIQDGRTARDSRIIQDGRTDRDSRTVQNGRTGQDDGSAQAGRRAGRKNFDSYECETCENRKYQDGSNDPGVSYKTPTALSPERAASAVRSHENEHVTREQAEARREDREVVSQSVTYHSAICPECGRVYISGGTTRTVTKGEVDQTYGRQSEEKGKYIDYTV